jgi:hypothetical protein
MVSGFLAMPGTAWYKRRDEAHGEQSASSIAAEAWMGYIFSVLLLVAGVIALAAYNGTPSLIGATCGPVVVFTYSFFVDIDCPTLRTGELIVTFACFLLAIFALFNARPRGTHRRW